MAVIVLVMGISVANRHGRSKVTVLHKANIMKMTDGLFLDCAERAHKEDYPNIRFDSRLSTRVA